MGRGLGILLMFFLFGKIAQAQLDSVAVCLEKIKQTTEDSLKLRYAEEIEHWIQAVPFGSYDPIAPVKYLGYKKSDHPGIELYSWVVPLQQKEAYYNLFRFKDSKKEYWIKSVSGDDSAWLFYDFIPFERQKQDYLLLLGWSKTRNTNQKVILVSRFNRNGKVSFNHPFLRKGRSKSASLSFEYALEGSMMLKQDKKGKRIIFDHLAPLDKKYEGYFMFYGPDASCDALVLKKGEWWYEEEVGDKK